VEHTVTEEVTGVDIVQTQMRIAAGVTLPEMGLTQDKIRVSGFAVQCR
jgi:pyruvate carboxylase